MDTAPGARGIVIGDRYRVAGALRRTGLIDAVDLEADRTEAACRVVGVPGDAERVDAWEDAWRAAQDAARLPSLRELVADDDGAHWAVLAPAPAGGRPLPDDAPAQARAIGEALAEAGLDVDDVSRTMLVAGDDGELCLDGAVWLGGERSPRAAGRALAELLPRAPEPAMPGATAEWAPPRRRPSQRRPRRARILVPAAIVATLVAAAAVLLVPARSGGTAVVAPGASFGGDDAILGSAASPLVVSDAVAASTAGRSEDAPSSEPTGQPVSSSPPIDDAPVTVTVVVTAPTAPVAAAPPAPAPPEIPAAAAQHAPDLPVAASVPALPAAAGG